MARALPPSDLPSLRFDHKDWELVCDNTRTCRAAGYHAEGDEQGISILLTRRAGPNQPVTVEVQLANFDGGGDFPPLPSTLTMAIDGRMVGQVRVDPESYDATLEPEQVRALLPALRKDAAITWSGGGETWTISTAGSNAVLLKMDDFQGRLGTPGALVKKGDKPEASVLPALAKPISRKR